MPKSRNNLEVLRKKAGLTREELADRLGVTATTIYRKERAVRKLYDEEIPRYAAALGCRENELTGTLDVGDNLVPILGKVEIGNYITPIANLSLIKNVAEHGRGYMQCEFVEAPPELGYRDVAAVRISGDSMEPFMPAGTIVYYSQRHIGDLKDCLNKLCVVHLKTGQTMLKKVKQGSVYGRYTLTSFNAADIENVEIEWCAKVTFFKQS